MESGEEVSTVQVVLVDLCQQAVIVRDVEDLPPSAGGRVGGLVPPRRCGHQRAERVGAARGGC